MAHRAGKASTKLGRDSQPQYLGIKLFDGQKVKPGNIIVRQRGSRYLPGTNVRQGSDNTLYAVAEGSIKFRTIAKMCFDGTRRIAKIVNVIGK